MIELAEGLSTKNQEVSENVIVGWDDQDRVVSIEILNGVRELFVDLISAEVGGRAADPRKADKRADGGA